MTDQKKIVIIAGPNGATLLYLVPTRRVGTHTIRAAVCHATRRVETALPRSAWERDLFSSPQPSPAGEGVYGYCNPLFYCA